MLRPLIAFLLGATLAASGYAIASPSGSEQTPRQLSARIAKLDRDLALVKRLIGINQTPCLPHAVFDVPCLGGKVGELSATVSGLERAVTAMDLRVGVTCRAILALGYRQSFC